MWNTSVKIEYIAGLIVDALENYSVNRENICHGFRRCNIE